MSRFIRSLTAAAMLLLGTFTAGECVAQGDIPLGRWELRTTGFYASVTLRGTGGIGGGFSGSAPSGMNLDGCAFSGTLSAERFDQTGTTAHGTALMSWCKNPALNGLRDAAIAIHGGQMSITFAIVPGGQPLFVVDGLRQRILLGAGATSEILDSRLPGHWQGSAGNVSAGLGLTRIGGISGTVTGPGLSGCKFAGSIPPAGAFENDEGAFLGIGAARMTACSDATRNRTYAVLLGATPQSLSFAFIDISDESELFSVEGMTRSALLGVTPASRGATAGMWYVPNESGWGLSLTLGLTTAKIPFVVLYVYSGATPTWYVMPSGTWTADARFEGDLFATTGTDWRTSTFTPGTVTKVGRLSMTFSSDDSAKLEYTVTDSTGTHPVVKTMQKQTF